jgi:hypothetical protein
MTTQSQWICQENIRRFRTLCAGASDEAERAILAELLRREEVTLAALKAPPPAADRAPDPRVRLLRAPTPISDDAFSLE